MYCASANLLVILFEEKHRKIFASEKSYFLWSYYVKRLVKPNLIIKIKSLYKILKLSPDFRRAHLNVHDKFLEMAL